MNIWYIVGWLMNRYFYNTYRYLLYRTNLLYYYNRTPIPLDKMQANSHKKLIINLTQKYIKESR